VALDSDSGKILWRYTINSRLESNHIDGQTLVIARRPSDREIDPKPSFVWLELNSGTELGHSAIEMTDGELIHFGPMLLADGKWWGFVGKSNNDPKRTLSHIRATFQRRP
jgi:hypothetical protein